MDAVETLQNFIHNEKNQNSDRLDLIFSNLDKTMPLVLQLGTLMENDQYRKIPNLLIESIGLYEKFQRIPNLTVFKILKRFYFENSDDKLSKKSNDWVLEILERLEKNFESEEIFTSVILAGFEFPCKAIEFQLAKILPNFQFYSTPTDQIIRLLLYAKSNGDPGRLLEMKNILQELRRILNLLSCEKRKTIENLLDSFSFD